MMDSVVKNFIVDNVVYVLQVGNESDLQWITYDNCEHYNSISR